MLAEMVFQKCLIDSHALFSPSKRDSHLKSEPAADQILKEADHEATTEDEPGVFCRSFASICDVTSELAVWHCCGLKALPVNGPSGIFWTEGFASE
jgi:hypothetical protein